MASNTVRIIGGKWRGRKLKFPDVRGLRPSQDRARETLFNWLTPWLSDAHCLDLFAGSGALGFEALSRGAASAHLVESQRAAYTAINNSKAQLDAIAATIHHSDALRWLQRNKQPFDLVFVDPPFDSPLAEIALDTLVAGSHLGQDALVYLELPRRSETALPDTNWDVFRDKNFGDTRALLLQQKPC